MKNVVLFDNVIEGFDYKAIGSIDKGDELAIILVELDKDENNKDNWHKVEVSEYLDSVEEDYLDLIDIMMVESLLKDGE